MSENECNEVDIDKIIETYIKLKLTLDQIKSIIKSTWDRLELSNYDCHYIEHKYTEVLIYNWLEKGPELVYSNVDLSEILNFASSLNQLNSYNDCQKFADSCDFLKLIINLSSDSKKLKDREQDYVFQFKQKCLYHLALQTGDVKTEIQFIQCFVEVMKYSVELEQLCLKLEIEHFLTNKSSLNNVLAKLDSIVSTNKPIVNLQQVGKEVLKRKNFVLIKNLKEIISTFLKPVIVSESKLDGRAVLEVSGKHIVISKVLTEIEKEPRFYKIEEVRFVHACVVHADIDLKQVIWHGKNIVLLVETLIVSKDRCIVWDVSGNSSNDVMDPAKTSVDGFGLTGSEGNPGESGGNVLIIVGSIEGGQNLTIKSNGGNGSKGQAGGNSKDGKDGYSVCRMNFIKKFPPVSNLNDELKLENVETTMRNILLKSVKTVYWSGTRCGNISNDEFDRLFSNMIEAKQLVDFFFEVQTTEGCEITFSFCYEGIFTFCQSFLLHKGSPGEVGKAGGEGGIGGSGGFAGDIQIEVYNDHQSCNVICTNRNGTQGPQGNMGQCGQPGNSGPDIAYMDCSYTLGGNKWPKIVQVGPMDDKRLTIEYDAESSSDSVFCPHKKLYGKVTTIKKSMARSLKQNFDLKHVYPQQTVQSIRKKTINKKTVTEQYKQNLSDLDIHKLSNSFKNAMDNFSEMITEKKMQTEQVITEKTVKKQVSYFSHDFNLRTLKISEKNISIVPKETFDSNNFRQDSLKFSHHLQNQLNSIDANCSISQTESIVKCQLAVFEHVKNSCIDHTFVKEDYRNDVSLKILQYYPSMNIFNISEEQDLCIKEYFCEDLNAKREEILNVCKSLPIDEFCLKQSISAFINEFGNSFGSKPIIKLLYKTVDLLEINNENKLKTLLLPINNLLKSTELHKWHSILIKSVMDQDSNIFLKFVNKLQKDKFLNKLVNMYSSKTEVMNDWTMTLGSGKTDKVKEILEVFYIEFKDKGPFAAFYREFLANYFNVNILLYSVNEHDQMVLVSNHNPSAKPLIPVLVKNDKFCQLQVDYAFLEMIQIHQARSTLYSKILLHVESFDKKQDFDEFISSSSFLSDDYKWIDKSRSIELKILQILTQDEDINIITETFPLYEDKITLRSRLEKLKLEYIGFQNILHYMAFHFKNEGNHMTTKEFDFVINFILKSTILIPQSIPLICWIIAVNHQTYWLIEITLLKLELNFKKIIENEMKNKWRTYLSNQNEKERLLLFFEKIDEDNSLKLNLKCIDETLYLLNSIPSSYIYGIEEFDLSEWKYYLKDKYWMCKLAPFVCLPEEQLNLASFYLVSLENSCGMGLTTKFINILKKNASGVIPKTLEQLLINTLKILHDKKIHLDDRLLRKLSNTAINNWKDEIERTCLGSDTERSLQQLVELIRYSDNTSDKILNSLDNILKCVEKCNTLITTLENKMTNETKLKTWISALLKVLEKIKELDGKERLNKEINIEKRSAINLQLKNIVSEDWIVELFQSISTITDSTFGRNSKKSVCHEISLISLNQNLNIILLATIVITIRMTYKSHIFLRNTQKLAIMTLLESGKNILTQVSTGEGKSLIVVSVAIIKAVQGQKVDIITSSHILAERDAHDYKNIYNLFGVQVEHNCSEFIEDRKKAYSSCQVVYGELANFQRDYLLDRIYDKNMLGDRKRQTVLVDEVDSMMLDKGNNTLYLSHDIPGLDKLEPLFIYIWTWLNKPSGTDRQINIVQLKERILFEIGQIKKEYIKELDMNLTSKQIDTIWKTLIVEDVITRNGSVKKQEIDYGKIASKTEHLIEIGHLSYLLKKVNERDKSFEIPNYLKDFVEDHLEEWINSALRAMSLENGRDYIVDCDRSGTSTDISPNITIIDHDTGTDQVNSQWDEGLHQFLQLKHGCRLSLISLKAVFVSNVSYLKFYEVIYGLSGTLGSLRELELLKEIYKVDFVTIPTAKIKSLTEEISIVCSDIHNWANTIFKEVYKRTKSRSVLIICETVNDVLYLNKYFKKTAMSSKKTNQIPIHTYTRDYEELSIADNLVTGQIIISTNLAGRGTDIKLSKELIAAGGLHVCLAYLPNNTRVEEQAYGRSARNGEPGSAQMIFLSKSHTNAAKIVDIKKTRDINEVLRITDLKKYYETQIKHEEECFSKFQQSYSKLKDTNHHGADIKSILLQTCLDRWAFWLDRNSKQITSVSIENFIKNFLELGSKDFLTWSKGIKDPFQLTKLGLAYLKMKDYKKSISLFDRVIKEEECFSEAAHYYQICAKAGNGGNLKRLDLLEGLKIVEKKLKERTNAALLSAQTIDILKDRNPNSLLQIDSYKQQQINVSNIYSIYLQSIYSIIGDEISVTETLLASFEHEKYASYKLYNDLLDANVIKKTLKATINDCDLSFVSKYGISIEEMKHILAKQVIQFNEKDLLKDLKVCLPTRELFWRELLFHGILRYEEKYVFVNVQSVQSTVPFFPNVFEKLLADIPNNYENSIWLYNAEEFKPFIDQQTYLVFKTYKLRKFIGEKLYKFLKRTNLIHCNKKATIFLQSNVDQFRYFDTINENDFKKIGVAGNIAPKLITELKKLHVINDICESQSSYSLNVNGDRIKIQLPTHKAYSEDIKALLTTCFAFRTAFKKMNNAMNHGNDLKNIYLHLPAKLHTQLLQKLKEEGIIIESIRNLEMDVPKCLKELYPETMNLEGWNKLFAEVSDDSYIRLEIIKELIENKWLLPKLPLNKCYSINCSIIDERYDKQKSSHFKEKMELIKFILVNYMIITNHTYIGEQSNSRKGSIYEVGDQHFRLESLLKILQKENMPTSECLTFYLNGFHEVISLEEKPWSLKMIISTIGVLALGIAEVVAGAALLSVSRGLFGFGYKPILEGLNDITYAINSLISGNFSSRQYVSNKIISMICNSFSSTYRSVSGIFASTFNLVLTMYGKKRNVDKTIAIENITKRVVSATATTLAQGTAYSTLHQIIEPEIDQLKEVIIDVIHAEIDNTILSHPVIEHIQKIYNCFGKNEAQIIVSTCFEDIIKQHQDISKHNWQTTFKFINTGIQNNITLFIEEQSGCSIYASSQDYFHTIVDLIQRLKRFVKAQRTFCMYINILVSKVFDDLLKALEEKVDVNSCDNPMERSNTDILNWGVSSFIDVTVCDWKKEIKEIFSTHISQNVTDPVLQATVNRIVEYSNKILLNNNSKFLNSEELCELAKLKNKYIKTNEMCLTEVLNKPSVIDTEYNEILLQLFKKQSSVTILSEIIKKNIPVDTNCVKVCCEIILLAIRREGILLPGFEIILECNDVYESYKTVGAEIDVPTIILTPNKDLLKQLANKNRFYLRSTIDIVCNSLLQHNPELTNFTSDSLYNSILCSLESDIVTQQFVNMYCSNKPKHTPNNRINNLIEKTVSYQHSHSEGSWTFIPSVDVDLRKENKLRFLSDIEKHVKEGFIIAVKKINSHIFSVQDYLKPPFNIDLEEFMETKHKIVPQTKNTTICDFHCYPIQYELVIPLPLETSTKLVNFSAIMSLKDNIGKAQPYSPHGPHILYEVHPVTDLKHLSKGIKGHILLNKECQDSSYSLNDCTVAGDLILPSGFKYPAHKKCCEILIINDSSTLKHLSMYVPPCIMQCTSEIVPYPGHTKSSDLRLQVYTLLKQFTGVKCVVLYMGNSSIATKVTELTIATDIGNTVIEIQSHLENVKIILCSLLKKYLTASKNNKKIERINKYLYSFCGTMNITYLDINNVLGPKEFGISGSGLNKQGYMKLGHHIVGSVRMCYVT